MESHLQGLLDAQLRNLDDRYGLRHLAYHLEASGRIRDLHRLLRVEWRLPQKAVATSEKESENRPTKEQDRVGQDEGYQNAWYTVREEVNQIGEYLADISLARQLAEKRIFDRRDTGSSEIAGVRGKEWLNTCIGFQCRYALIQASLNMHADNIRSGLLVELIMQEIWLAGQGLSYARQITGWFILAG